MAFESKYGVARHIYIPVIKRAVVDFAVGADWTPAAGDVKISKDGGAAANVTNLPTAIAMGNAAMWDFSITATEMQAAQIMVTVADSATKAVEDTMFIIETYGNASAQHGFDISSATPTVDVNKFGTTAVTGRDLGASVLLSAGTGTGQLDFTSGVVKANLAQILATALTETAGQIAGGFKKFFNIGTPAATMDHLILVDTATALTTNNDKTGYALGSNGLDSGALTAAAKNAIADSVLDRNMATGTDSGTDSTATRTPRQALRVLRNKAAIAAGTLTVNKEDDATASWTAAVTTSAGNPISTVDPT